VDGRSVGRFFAEEVADPLKLEIFIGLPEDLEPRVSTLYCARTWAGVSQEQIAADDLAARVLANPPLFTPGLPMWNTCAFHRAEIPGGGGIATARSVARLYGALANGGEIDGVRLAAPGTIARARQCLTRRRDPLSGKSDAFGLGFALQTQLRLFGWPDDAFGHGGAGGSMHGAWPKEGVGFSYCMNEMRDDHEVDPRAQALLGALYRALGDSGPGTTNR
jgi:CubicO group peptidase (beta-lactamase class C family)